MTRRPCCSREGSPRPLARLWGAASSVLPGTALLALPKCPLCLAAWLTAATGIGVPAAWAAQVRWLIVALWVAAVAFYVLLRQTGRVRRRAAAGTAGPNCAAVGPPLVS